MGRVTVVNSLSQFQEIINSGKVVVFDFWATWCGPCRVISPKFETLSDKHPEMEFYKVDVDDVPAVAEEVGIRAMPTFMAFKDGAQIDSLQGALPAKLEALILKASTEVSAGV